MGGSSGGSHENIMKTSRKSCHLFGFASADSSRSSLSVVGNRLNAA